jgi:hypothetical protein
MMQMMLLLVTLNNLTILDMRYGCCASEDDDVGEREVKL